jgi:hypothetical protein
MEIPHLLVSVVELPLKKLLSSFTRNYYRDFTIYVLQLFFNVSTTKEIVKHIYDKVWSLFWNPMS